MSEREVTPLHCSFMDPENEMRPCDNEAAWACRVDAGPWMLGAWLCNVHKPIFEDLLPVITLSTGGHRVIPVHSILHRSPLILHLDYLATGQHGVPMTFKCDICDEPITRNYDQDRWDHVDAERDRTHEARVG